MNKNLFRHSRLWLSCLTLLIPVFLSAQAGEALSLSQAIQMGLANNYQIQIADANTAIANNNNDWAIAGKYPAINLTLNNQNTYSNLNNPGSVLRESNSFSPSIVPGVELNWTLFNGYRVRYTKTQLEELEKLNAANARQRIESSIQLIIQAYYNTVVQQEQLEVVAELLRLSRDRLAYQQLRQEYGQSGTFEKLQSQDAYLNDSSAYLIQVNNYETALRGLRLSMGIEDASRRFVLTDTLQTPVAAYRLEDLETQMLANNHALQSQYINRELASVNTKIQESTLKPTLSMRAGTTYNLGISFGEQTFNFGGNTVSQDIPQIAAKTFTGFVNFSAAYPIFDAGVRQKRIENARTEELIAQYTISDTKRSLQNQLANTLAAYQLQQGLVQLSQSLEDNARQNLAIAEERFRGSLINSFDYRSIQLAYLNASQQRLNALLNLKNTETELVRLIGGLVR
ncbi:MAG TPA: TolC family protein [Saprospiraceae bacterium]|nr:TolC family protein [Saprospiraceae bacterium]HMQ85857.1 TolC family protein [Saprospiraceae bacterium]